MRKKGGYTFSPTNIDGLSWSMGIEAVLWFHEGSAQAAYWADPISSSPQLEGMTLDIPPSSAALGHERSVDALLNQGDLNLCRSFRLGSRVDLDYEDGSYICFPCISGDATVSLMRERLTPIFGVPSWLIICRR